MAAECGLVKEVREDSVTVNELAEVSCCAASTARLVAKKKCNAGEWRKVFKRVGNRLEPAFIRT